MVENIKAIRKYNFWDGNKPDLGFFRMDYTAKIAQYTNNRLIKVLIGQRRSGKSYILRQVAAYLIEKGVKPQNILYVNKEYMEYGFLSDDQSLEAFYKAYRKALKPRGKVFLFMDEIQNIVGWERFVNSHAQDFAEKCEIFITGSNSEMLAGELATLLSGRYVTFRIFPLSFTEYAQVRKKKNTKNSYVEYLQESGLPELLYLNNEEMRRNYVSAVKDTILLRDIVQRYKVKDVRLLEDLFVYLVNNASNLFSVANIVNYFAAHKRKTNYETLSSYLSYIESACLIHKVERYNVRGKDVLTGSCKYYLNDHAFKNYLYPGFAMGAGYALENNVFLDLLRTGYTVYTGHVRDKEVDFVAAKGDRTIYLQCAYVMAESEKTIAREYEPLENIRDNFEKYVVTLDDLKLPSRNGIKHVQAWKLHEIL